MSAIRTVKTLLQEVEEEEEELRAVGISVVIHWPYQRRRRPPSSPNKSGQRQAFNFLFRAQLVPLRPAPLVPIAQQVLTIEARRANSRKHLPPEALAPAQAIGLSPAMAGVKVWLSEVVVVLALKAVALVVFNSHHRWRPTMLERVLAAISPIFNAEVARVMAGHRLGILNPTGGSKAAINPRLKSSNSRAWVTFQRLTIPMRASSNLVIESEAQ